MIILKIIKLYHAWSEHPGCIRLRIIHYRPASKTKIYLSWNIFWRRQALYSILYALTWVPVRTHASYFSFREVCNNTLELLNNKKRKLQVSHTLDLCEKSWYLHMDVKEHIQVTLPILPMKQAAKQFSFYIIAKEQIIRTIQQELIKV